MSEAEWLDIFGDNLMTLLRDARMTQRELADAAGLSEGSVSNYISKRRMPTVRALINMADVLDVTLDEFMYFGDTIE